MYTAYKPSEMAMSKIARVEQAAPSKPPALSAGQITPEVLRAWENGCTQFFLHKEVKDDKKVKKVAWGMQDPIVKDWYLNDQAKLDALTFAEYMKEVRMYWLPTDWADTVRRKMLASIQGQRPFSEWAVDVQSQNTLLRGTTSHLDDKNLLYHLEAHMNNDLAANYHAEGISEPVLCKWVEKVRLLDEKRLHYVARQKEAVDTALRAERAQAGTERKSSNARPFTKNQSASTSTKTFVHLPTLSDVERQLLRDNDGCFKCRQPFAGHTSNTCSKGFPDGATYKPLTAATIVLRKPKKDGSVVAAVEVEETTNTVAVVMLVSALGNGTDSDNECVAPLQTSHLRWNCLIDGPTVSSPIPVNALIDHGSSLVLIGEDLVTKLGLRR